MWVAESVPRISASPSSTAARRRRVMPRPPGVARRTVTRPPVRGRRACRASAARHRPREPRAGGRRGARRSRPRSPARVHAGRGGRRAVAVRAETLIGRPGPSSATSIRTRSPVARTRTRTTPPPCSAALPTRFAHAWAIRSGSAKTVVTAREPGAACARRWRGARGRGRAAAAARPPQPPAASSPLDARHDQRRLDPQVGAVARGECPPRGCVGVDQLGEVDELAARAGAPARRARR